MKLAVLEDQTNFSGRIKNYLLLIVNFSVTSANNL